MLLVYLLMMNEKLTKRIQLFWQGKLSEKARRELLSELDEKDSKLRAEMEEQFDNAAGNEPLHSQEEYELYWRKILEKTGQQDTLVRPRRTWLPKWVAAAAVLVIVGLAYLVSPTLISPKHIASTGIKQQVRHDTIQLRNDGAGEKEFILIDSSKVILYSGSSIAYDERYGIQGRAIQLTGQAKFSVSPDTTQPFVVEANGYTTTALGTSFIIDARNAGRINVKLLTGKVLVRSTPKTPYVIKDQRLLPGDELAIDVQGADLKRRTLGKKTSSKKESAVSSYPEQVEDLSLHFEETSLKEVLRRLSINRAISFDVKGVNIGDLYFTGDFSRRDDLKTILDIISVTNGLEYELQNNKSVKIRPSRASKHEK